MPEPTSVPETIPENAPDTVGTPEGDNEFAPDQPLSPTPPDVTRPRGDEPHSEQPIRPAQD